MENNNLYHEYEISHKTNHFLYGVYGWMTGGLIITGTIAYLLSQTPSFMLMLYQHPWLLFAVALVQIGLVIMLSARGLTMNFFTAATMFLLYAASVGLTMSTIFALFTNESIAQTFFITAGTFGAMALYGYTTQSDLSGMRSLLMMGLVGIILASIVNIFLKNGFVQIAIAAFGVVIFTLLTAYDMQKIKGIPHLCQQYNIPLRQASLLGSLTLYLDFINLFIFMLNLTGRQKN